MKLSRKIISGILATSFAVAAFTGCTSYDTGDEKVYSYDEAVTELEAFNKEINSGFAITLCNKTGSKPSGTSTTFFPVEEESTEAFPGAGSESFF